MVRSNNLKYLLNSIKAPIDKNIKFIEEGHYYIYKDKKVNISVTGFISKFFGTFNADDAIDKLFKRPPELRGKYKDISREDIKKMWEDESKEASNIGTQKHKIIEDYIRYNIVINDKALFNMIYFDNIMQQKGYIKCEPEKILYSKKYDIAGMCDMIYKHNDGHYALADWKNCKKITSKCIEKALDPISDLNNCNYHKYCLQLNMYRYIGNTEYKVFNNKIDKMFVVNVNQNLDKPKIYEIPIMDEYIIKILNTLT
jgi:hypothetical protein